MSRRLLLAIVASAVAHLAIVLSASWLPARTPREAAAAIDVDLVEGTPSAAPGEEPPASAVVPRARPTVARAVSARDESVSPATVAAPSSGAPPPTDAAPAPIDAGAALPAGADGIPVHVMASGASTGSPGGLVGTAMGFSGATAGSAGRVGSGTAAGSVHGAILARLRARTAGCYPRAAVRRSVEGVARVAFCVGDGGDPEGLRLVASSGSRLLDDAAIDCVVRGAIPLPGAGACVRVPVDFRLRR